MRASLEGASFAAEVAKAILDIEKRHGDWHCGRIEIRCCGEDVGMSLVENDGYYDLDVVECE